MSDELARVRERVRQNRAARRQALTETRAFPPCPEGRLGCMYQVGDRVFDLVSGQEGVVVGGTRENIVVPTPHR